MKTIAPGIYQDDTGAFWARPWIHHRRTWRKLKAVKIREAMKEAAGEPWTSESENFHSLATLYVDAGCPNRRLEPRPPAFVTTEARRVETLRAYFGPMPISEITLPILPRYNAWRRRLVKRGPGARTVDKDLNTLSNVLNYGVNLGQLAVNPVGRMRPRYQAATVVRHAREVAPASADDIHRIAGMLFEHSRSEVFGWQTLFAMFTGCRTSELLRLRTDAACPDDPGFIQNGYLFLGRRSKGGVNPWAMIGPEFSSMLDCYHRWHTERWPLSPWYFPSPTRSGQHVNNTNIGHALARACADLGLAHVTPHGLRSYYVTKRRSDGVADTVIAGEIGDQTISLMQTTYGSRPANWTGGQSLGWRPTSTLPVWMRWQPEERKVVSL